MASLIKILDNAKFLSKTVFGEVSQQIQWVLSGGIWKDNLNWNDDLPWQD